MKTATERALTAAENTCLQRGVRLTTLRRSVLAEILNTGGVIKAYDLIHQLGQRDRHLKPPSVYRSLAFLLEQGFIHRIESLNGFVACNHPGELHETLLMICERCGSIVETQPSGIEQLLQDSALEHGFQIGSTTLELQGLCHLCRKPGNERGTPCALPPPSR